MQRLQSQHDIISLGSTVVIHPVRDLGFTDFFSSGSLRKFGFSLKHRMLLYQDTQLVIITSSGGILINARGALSTMLNFSIEAESSEKSYVDN